MMFSGIVEAVGRVESMEPAGGMIRFALSAPELVPEVRESDSVCVNGVCLTVTGVEGEKLLFDAVPETLSRSNLGELEIGSPVNLERSLAVGQRLGGHFVQGHVDATATLLEIHNVGDSWELAFETAPELAPLLVEKGSIALDGISLTLAEVDRNRFKIAVIPFTWEHTNIGVRKVGERVNVEADILGKHVLRALACMREGGPIPETLLGV
jgi:riboflavin synthase